MERTEAQQSPCVWWRGVPPSGPAGLGSLGVPAGPALQHIVLQPSQILGPPQDRHPGAALPSPEKTEMQSSRMQTRLERTRNLMAGGWSLTAWEGAVQVADHLPQATADTL